MCTLPCVVFRSSNLPKHLSTHVIIHSMAFQLTQMKIQNVLLWLGPLLPTWPHLLLFSVLALAPAGLIHVSLKSQAYPHLRTFALAMSPSGTREYNKYLNFMVLSKYNFHGHLEAVLKDSTRKTYSFIYNIYKKYIYVYTHIQREREGEKGMNQLIKNYSHRLR